MSSVNNTVYHSLHKLQDLIIVLSVEELIICDDVNFIVKYCYARYVSLVKVSTGLHKFNLK